MRRLLVKTHIFPQNRLKNLWVAMKKTIECKNSKTWWLGLKESLKRLKQNLKVFPILGPAQEILEIRQNNKLLQNREVSSRWKKLICIWTRVWIRIWWSSLLMTRKYRRPSLLLTWTGMGTWVQAKLGLCLTRWVRLPQTKKLTKWYGWLTLIQMQDNKSRIIWNQSN